jgi:hypothetical protein
MQGNTDMDTAGIPAVGICQSITGASFHASTIYLVEYAMHSQGRKKFFDT